IFGRPDIIEVWKLLLLYKRPEDVHIAMGVLIRREDVVIRNHHHLLRIPDARLCAELFLKYLDRSRPADIMRHQHIHVDPDVIPRLNRAAAGMPGQNFFSDRHAHVSYAPPIKFSRFNSTCRGFKPFRAAAGSSVYSMRSGMPWRWRR